MAFVRSCLKNSGRPIRKYVGNFEVVQNLTQPKYNIFSWSKKENPVDKCSPSGCRRPGPEPKCPDVCQGCPSKCLEVEDEKPEKRKWLFGKRPKAKAKEKPSNCLPEPVPPRETFWEYIFGPEKELPDPRVCREEYLKQKRCRQYDVRLCDPRYNTTPGGFYLVYTEYPNEPPTPRMERQPRGPPPYKEPRSVTGKRLAEAVASPNFVRVRRPIIEEDAVIKMYQYDGPEPMRLPYQEMRPTAAQRKMFSCREGILPEDVIPAPFYPPACHTTTEDFNTKASDYVDLPESFFAADLEDKTTKEDPANVCTKPQKLSRIERLHLLIASNTMTPTSPVCTDTKAIAPDPKSPYPCDTRCEKPPPRIC